MGEMLKKWTSTKVLPWSLEQFHEQVVGRAAYGSKAQCFSDTSEFHCS